MDLTNFMEILWNGLISSENYVPARLQMNVMTGFPGGISYEPSYFHGKDEPAYFQGNSGGAAHLQ